MERNTDPNPQFCELKALYDSEMCKLKELEVEYSKVSTTSLVFSNKQNPGEVLKCRKMFRLMAELSVLESSSPQSIPMNGELLLLAAKEELLSEIEDLESLERNLQEEKETLLQAQCKVKSDLEEERRHLNAVKQKCISEGIDLPNDQAGSGTEVISAEESAGDDERHNLKKRVYALRALSKYWTSQLFKFVNTHFPVPSKSQVKSVASNDIFYESSDSRMNSLTKLINHLLTSHITEPQQSWVKLDSTYWIPHVEFLVRCGVAVRKLEDPSLLKLENFDS